MSRGAPIGSAAARISSTADQQIPPVAGDVPMSMVADQLTEVGAWAGVDESVGAVGGVHDDDPLHTAQTRGVRGVQQPAVAVGLGPVVLERRRDDDMPVVVEQLCRGLQHHSGFGGVVARPRPGQSDQLCPPEAGAEPGCVATVVDGQVEPAPCTGGQGQGGVGVEVDDETAAAGVDGDKSYGVGDCQVRAGGVLPDVPDRDGWHVTGVPVWVAWAGVSRRLVVCPGLW